MKKSVLCCLVALAFLFSLSVAMVQAQKGDEVWFKSKVSGKVIFINADGTITQERGKDKGFLFLSLPLPNTCGGWDYLVTIVGETAPDVFGVVGGGFLSTCDATETAFITEFSYDNGEGLLIDVEAVGQVKGDPKLKSKGCAAFAEPDSGALDVTGEGYADSIGKKCKLSASDVDCPKLPFDQEALGFPACPP